MRQSWAFRNSKTLALVQERVLSRALADPSQCRQLEWPKFIKHALADKNFQAIASVPSKDFDV